MAETAGSLRVEDAVVVAAYFLCVFAVGIWSSVRSRKQNLSGYFLASRNMHWIPVGASLFASNIGSGHFIGLAGTGAASGIAVAGFELSAVFWLIVLGWVFVPVYLSAGVYTMPEYLRLRLGGQRIRVYLSVLAILLYVLTKISVDLYAGALFIQRVMRWQGDTGLYVSMVLLLLVAAAFTMLGGLAAVVWTDLAQMVLMVGGATVLAAIALSAVGGYGSLVQRYMQSVPSANVSLFDNNNRSCGAVRHDAMHLFRDPVNSDLPWPGMVFGMAIISLWYWCSDQVIVQRTLAARSVAHAKAGTVLAALLKMLPMWLMVLPGMAARVLYTDRVACSDPEACWRLCHSRTGCSNLAYIELVVQLLPPGLSGLMLAVMLAALISSLTSIFNSASTLFSIDIYKRIRTHATEIEQVIVGRAFVVVMVGVSIVWVPIINNFSSDQLFVYIQSMQSYLPPPICAVYLLSIFWSRTTEKGAFCGLVVGFAIGVARFAMEFSFPRPACGSTAADLRPAWVLRAVFDIHYLHFGPLLFLVVCAVVVAVSLLTEPLPADCLHRLTFWSRHSTAVRRPLPDAGEVGHGDGGAARRDDKPDEFTLAAESGEPPSACRRAISVLCCVTRKPADVDSATANQQLEPTASQGAQPDAYLLHETRKQRITLNIAAAFACTCSGAIYVYYR